MRLSRRRVAVIGFLAVGLLVAYLAWTTLLLALDVRGIRAQAAQVKSTIERHETRGAQAALRRLVARVDGARDRASSPGWWMVERLPWLGDDARAVTSVTRASQEIADQALPALVRAASGDIASSLVPRGGRIDTRGLVRLRPTAGLAARSFTRAATELDSVDRRGLLPPVRRAFDSVLEQVDGAARAMRGVSVALRIMPGMLGANGERSYVTAFASNAEVRSTGGFAGSVGLMEARAGKVRLVDQVAGGAIVFPEPVDGQSESERALYGTQPARYFGDTNFMPDYGRTSDLMREMWRRRYGRQVDGTITLDVVTLAYLLRATGPVTVEGQRLSADNVVQELLNRTYVRIPRPAQQDAFFARVAKAVFDRVANTSQPVRLLEALAQGAAEGRVLVHSFRPAEQRVIAPYQVAGLVPTDRRAASRLGIYLQDATGSKMSYYLRRKVSVEPTACGEDGSRSYLVRATISSVAPENAATLPPYLTGGGKHGTPPGMQAVQLRVYGPAGGSVSHFRFDGQQVGVAVVDEGRRPVASPVVLLAPQQRTVLTWKVVTTPSAGRGLTVDLTPGLDPEPNARVVADDCPAS